MEITIKLLQEYLKDRYNNWATTENLFLKLVEEVGEIAEAINVRNGIKNSDKDMQFEEELADLLHYLIAIASINNIDLTKVIIEKDKKASVKYNHKINLEEFIIKNSY